MELYARAGRIFVPPDAAQFDTRLSILRDGKVLVMASPRLKDGVPGGAIRGQVLLAEYDAVAGAAAHEHRRDLALPHAASPAAF